MSCEDRIFYQLEWLYANVFVATVPYNEFYESEMNYLKSNFNIMHVYPPCLNSATNYEDVASKVVVIL